MPMLNMLQYNIEEKKINVKLHKYYGFLLNYLIKGKIIIYEYINIEH